MRTADRFTPYLDRFIAAMQDDDAKPSVIRDYTSRLTALYRLIGPPMLDPTTAVGALRAWRTLAEQQFRNAEITPQ
jgi:hypothetical protein